MKTHLLIVDPQNSFCDPKGELFVANADNDMKRLSEFISTHAGNIDRISITLDSHNRIHIAHPVWWVDENSNNPEPFTQITIDDIREGRWKPANPDYAKWSEHYLEHTETHVIWPYHCLTGTWGHEIYAPLKNALEPWAEKNPELDYYFKGSCKFTEHFSAIVPSVAVEDDPSTQPNIRLVNSLAESDTVIVAGEASSHCVAETVKDAVLMNTSLAGKMVLLTDAMSAVGGFENAADDFFRYAASKGIKTATTKSLF